MTRPIEGPPLSGYLVERIGGTTNVYPVLLGAARIEQDAVGQIQLDLASDGFVNRIVR